MSWNGQTDSGAAVERRFFCLLLLLSSVFAVVVEAQPVPSMQFSADYAFNGAGQTADLQVAYRDGLLRVKLRATQDGETAELDYLLDLPNETVVDLGPESDPESMEFGLDSEGQGILRTYGLVAPFRDLQNPCRELSARIFLRGDCRRIGNETLRGHLCERWRVVSAGLKSGKLDAWIDAKSAIPVKITGFNVSGMSGSLELKSLQMGQQPDALFEIPAGYRDSTDGAKLNAPLALLYAEVPDFSADFVSHEGRHRLCYKLGRMRLEMSASQIILADFQQKTFLLLSREQKTYSHAESTFNEWFQFFQPISPAQPCTNLSKLFTGLACRDAGLEHTANYDACKWELISPNGEVHVTVWIDRALHFAVKEVQQGATFRELQNIRQEPQPETLFEIPSGYTETRAIRH